MNLKQVDVIMSEVGEIEDEVFKRRKQAEVKEQVGRAVDSPVVVVVVVVVLLPLLLRWSLALVLGGGEFQGGYLGLSRRRQGPCSGWTTEPVAPSLTCHRTECAPFFPAGNLPSQHPHSRPCYLK